jgi:hypothetical protein
VPTAAHRQPFSGEGVDFGATLLPSVPWPVDHPTFAGLHSAEAQLGLEAWDSPKKEVIAAVLGHFRACGQRFW